MHLNENSNSGVCEGVVLRHEEILLVLIAGSTLALLTPSFISMNAEGAETDKTVLGNVYDLASQPLAGSDVTVEIWGGYWPDQDFFRVSESTVTDALGYYDVTFSSNFWDPHNTIKVIVTYGLSQETRIVEADEDPYQTVDVTMNPAIPEFSGSLGPLAMVAGCAVSISALLGRRRRYLP